MLINKYLSDHGCIFIKNSDPLYLRSLTLLGTNPIFIYIKNNIRIISMGIGYEFPSENELWRSFYLPQPYITSINYHQFTFDCCDTFEIKNTLYKIDIFGHDHYFSDKIFNPIYFVNI